MNEEHDKKESEKAARKLIKDRERFEGMVDRTMLHREEASANIELFLQNRPKFSLLNRPFIIRLTKFIASKFEKERRVRILELKKKNLEKMRLNREANEIKRKAEIDKAIKDIEDKRLASIAKFKRIGGLKRRDKRKEPPTEVENKILKRQKKVVDISDSGIWRLLGLPEDVIRDDVFSELYKGILKKKKGTIKYEVMLKQFFLTSLSIASKNDEIKSKMALKNLITLDIYKECCAIFKKYSNIYKIDTFADIKKVIEKAIKMKLNEYLYNPITNTNDSCSYDDMISMILS